MTLLSVADGCGNGYTLAEDEGGQLVLVYDPMTPEMSSSGEYSGGEPGRAAIDAATAAAICALVERMAEDTASHAKSRMMGTTMVRWVDANGEKKSFIVRNGSELLAVLKSALGRP